MAEKLFSALDVYRETVTHTAPMNMAIDEALLEHAGVPLIRFYDWKSPALSFGYFGRFAEVAHYASERDLVRRWTGGGVVFHGEDLTYSLVIPTHDKSFANSSMSIYEKVHMALSHALARTGGSPVMAYCPNDGPSFTRSTGPSPAALADCSCFANPVHADVLIDGRKIAGAAQRRTRRGLLQQGSIQGIALHANLGKQFAQALSTNCRERTIHAEILSRAGKLTEQKYGAKSWLQKR